PTCPMRRSSRQDAFHALRSCSASMVPAIRWIHSRCQNRTNPAVPKMAGTMSGSRAATRTSSGRPSTLTFRSASAPRKCGGLSTRCFGAATEWRPCATLLDRRNKISAHIYDQQKPREYAERQIADARSKVRLTESEKGEILKTPANICVALLKLGV